jgi:hypothetical protein
LFSAKTSRQIGFYGQLDTDGVVTGRLHFTVLVTNYGNAYSQSTGVFRAPVAGLYFFFASSTPNTNAEYARVYMKKNDSVICWLYSDSRAPGQSVSCSTVQHLAVGDNVYVDAQDSPDLENFGTHFSGFLIVAD